MLLDVLTENDKVVAEIKKYCFKDVRQQLQIYAIISGGTKNINIYKSIFRVDGNSLKAKLCRRRIAKLFKEYILYNMNHALTIAEFKQFRKHLKVKLWYNKEVNNKACHLYYDIDEDEIR